MRGITLSSTGRQRLEDGMNNFTGKLFRLLLECAAGCLSIAMK
jgi:hypothetical protein